MNKLIVIDNKDFKIGRSLNYNFDFNKHNGLFKRWGKTKEDDPQYSPYGPEILDIEITTVCNGINGQVCSYCYKSNTHIGKSMSLDSFKIIIDKININNTLTQVALGLGASGNENPDIWDMCKFLRNERGIIPNGTVAQINDETANNIATYFGACAVSMHGDKDVCYDSVKKLTDLGMKQINIHHVIYNENYEETLDVINDIKTDPRLQGLNALVLLSLKQKGRAITTGYSSLDQDKFNNLVKIAFEKKVSLGFDSCSAHKFLKAIENDPNKILLEQMVEPCESMGIFSSYVNVDGKYSYCSFLEEELESFDILNTNNFITDIWNSDIVKQRRDQAIKCNRNCPVYTI